MDVDRGLKHEFRNALDEVTPSAPWLRSSVKEEFERRRQPGWRAAPRTRAANENARAGKATAPAQRVNFRPFANRLARVATLVAALLLVVLMAAFVLGVHLRPTKPVTVAPPNDQRAVQQYQARLGPHLDKWSQFSGFACYPGASFCPPEIAAYRAVVQEWLDDLKSNRPPARFAALDSLMRLHLGRSVDAWDAMLAAYRAGRTDHIADEFDAAVNEANLASGQALNILTSSQGSVALYTAAVRLDRGYLVGCALCQRLITTGPPCEAGKNSTCIDEIEAIRLQVETFQGDLVRVYAPDSLATKDAKLQADLVDLDIALAGAESALNAGDQPGLDSARDAIRAGLLRVEADAEAIAGP